MRTCPQTESQSVMQHGLSVAERYKDLMLALEGKEHQYKWRMPNWDLDLTKYALDNQCDPEVAFRYHKYHDCGKPYCLEYDDQGRRHFPSHSEVSHQIFSKMFPDDKIGQGLVLHDMDVHLAKSADVGHIASLTYAPTLVLTTLAEVHANADMFGGIESTSFKIKWKQVNKRGRQILQQHKLN